MTPPIRRTSSHRLLLPALCAATAASLTLGILPLSAVAAPNAPAAPALPQDVIGLRQGAIGNDVKAVQNALLAAGVQVPGGADGVFGPATRSAVTAFQSRRGLPTTGEIDRDTAAALQLDNGSAGTPQGAARGTSSGTLSAGARGDAVAALQTALIDAGVWVAGGADGVFGPATKTAVTNFQRWNGLETTGTATPATIRALGLDGSAPAARPSPAPETPSTTESARSSLLGLKIGATGARVRSLQTALIAAGITVRGGADGAFGPMTRDAVIRFQTSKGLGTTGFVDRPTADALAGPAASPSGAPAPAANANPYVGMAVGATGNLVKELQRALMNSGLTLRGGSDGVFGNATKATLIVFQRTNATPQTGVVSAKDASVLGLGTGTAPQGITRAAGYPIYGERGDRVRTLQRSLLAAGISFAGGADGHFGAATAGAIMEFQRREGLPVTGKVDSSTADRLGNAKAPAPDAPSTNLSIDVFPVQGPCWFGDTWHAPRGGGRLHVGTDVIAAKGNRLYAVVDGRVSKVYADFPGALAGNGLRIERADGSYFTYLHLSRLANGVELGTPVTAGQVIGFVGNTGNSATPHLHFEAHPANGSAINPYPMLKAVDSCSVSAPRR